MFMKLFKRTRLIFPIISALLILTPIIVLAAIQKYDYHEASLTQDTVADGDVKRGTLFTASANYNVTYYDIYMKRTGTMPLPDTPVLVEFRYNGGSANWTGGGTVIASDTKGFMDIGTSYEWVRFYPSDNLSLISGNEYMLSVTHAAGDYPTYYISVRYQDGGSNAMWYTANGAPNVWLCTAGWDDNSMGFRVYGTTDTVYYPDGDPPVVVEGGDGFVYVCDDGNYMISTDNLTWVQAGYCQGEPGSEDFWNQTANITDNIQDSIEGAMDIWGMNNTAGRWMVILIGTLGSWVYFRYKRARVMSVIAPLCVIGFGIATTWIPAWIVIVFGIVIALFTYKTVFVKGE